MLGRTLQAIFKLMHRQLPSPVFVSKLALTKHEVKEDEEDTETGKVTYIKNNTQDGDRKAARRQQKLARRTTRQHVK